MSYLHCPSSGRSDFRHSNVNALTVMTSFGAYILTVDVQLQVQVPTSGSETVECGVCQHAFRVSAN